jgi:hypothetical protein
MLSTMGKWLEASPLRLAVLPAAFAVVSASAAIQSDDQVVVSHNPADPRFITSIERVGQCHKTTSPSIGGLRIPWQIYPKQSVDEHEEGSVIVELAFDAGWCIRKATIVESTGFWRLDNVTLVYLMKVRFTPKLVSIKQKDGEPTLVIRLGWGASRGQR